MNDEDYENAYPSTMEQQQSFTVSMMIPKINLSISEERTQVTAVSLVHCCWYP